MRYFLIGYMGCGKTTIGELVAQKSGLKFIDIDHLIEKKYSNSISKIFNKIGEEKFRELEKDTLTEAIELYPNSIIATGGGAPCHFKNMQLMNRNGITFYIYFTPTQLVERLILTDLTTRPIIAGLSKNELLDKIEKQLTEREKYYRKAHKTLVGTDDEITQLILNYIDTNVNKIV